MMEKRLGSEGRVLVRASGTEPLVRVMVEAREGHEAASIADDLVVVVRQRARWHTGRPGVTLAMPW